MAASAGRLSALHEVRIDPWFADTCGFLPRLGVATLHSELPATAVTPMDETYLRITPMPRWGGFSDPQQLMVEASALSLTTLFGVDARQVGYPADPTRLCVSIDLVDAAGNSSGSVALCDPCAIDRGPGSARCFPDTRACPAGIGPSSPAELCSTIVDAGVDAGADASVSDASVSDGSVPDASVMDTGVDASFTDAAMDAGDTTPPPTPADAGHPEDDAGPPDSGVMLVPDPPYAPEVGGGGCACRTTDEQSTAWPATLFVILGCWLARRRKLGSARR